jgi:hypothetical protein
LLIKNRKRSEEIVQAFEMLSGCFSEGGKKVGSRVINRRRSFLKDRNVLQKGPETDEKAEG